MHSHRNSFSRLKLFIRQILFYLGVLELLLACTRHHAHAQDDFGGGDEAGGGEDMMDMESMGIGADTGNSMGAKGNKPVMPELTYIEQSTRALQQLALVIGVAFMVAFLFLVMVGLEKAWDKMEEKYKESFGKTPQQENDPAALVGTFKRYKN